MSNAFLVVLWIALPTQEIGSKKPRGTANDVKTQAEAPRPGQNQAGERANAFSRANPNYRQRAGGFYEKKYLGPACQGLAKAAGLKEGQHQTVREVLTQYIYEWLDGYVRGGGQITRADHRRVLERMDGRIRKLLTANQFRAYLRWRQGKAGENALGFLMRR